MQNDIIYFKDFPNYQEGTHKDNGKFDFIIECYQVLNDFYDQIGLARALCKKVQYTMQKKYELDSTGTKAKITVSGNDNHMCLEYYASNGEYEFAKKI